jgi:LmbE family N-acetylglucosaminyl deacetylase
MRSLIRKGESVLAIGAHPDDIEMGAGGFLARLVNEGFEVTMAIVSVPTHPELRRQEAARGAGVIGAKLRFLDLESRRVEDWKTYELVGAIDALVADVKPQLTITHGAHDLHWDHSLVNRASMAAFRRTPCNLLTYGLHAEVNAPSRSRGQGYVDISATIDRKLEALASHQSQLPRLDLDATRDVARTMGRLGGFQFAELFEVMQLRL